MPTPTLNCWIKDGEMWKADVEKLKAAVLASPNSEIFIRKKMGRGYEKLEAALRGEPVSIWSIVNIEYGLEKDYVREHRPATHGGP